MRISNNPKDRGYREDWYNYNIFLDDKQLKYCHTADEAEKIAYGYLSDSDGEVLTRNLKPIERFWVGKIKIVKEE